jgi:hypothetical protein
MRILVLLLLAAAPEDLTPREGSGWAGFPAGTWIRLKQTRLQPGKMLVPTITRYALSKADAKTLTLAIKTENALGVSNEVQQVVVPATGDAGTGETEKVEGLGEEAMRAAGKDLLCDKVQATVTGPAGKRVVTKWIARDPKVFAKRVTVTYGVDGKEASRETLLLLSLSEERTVGDRKIRCVKYERKLSEADFEWQGTAYLSREMPGGLVWSEDEIRQKGEVLLTQRAEIIEFGSK